MKTLKSATKFVFTTEDCIRIQEVGKLINLIYHEIGEEEAFLGNNEDDMINISNFFFDFTRAIERGISIDGETTIECRKID